MCECVVVVVVCFLCYHSSNIPKTERCEDDEPYCSLTISRPLSSVRLLSLLCGSAAGGYRSYSIWNIYIFINAFTLYTRRQSDCASFFFNFLLILNHLLRIQYFERIVNLARNQ